MGVGGGLKTACSFSEDSFYKHNEQLSFKTLKDVEKSTTIKEEEEKGVGERRERERQTDRQTDRQTETDRERERKREREEEEEEEEEEEVSFERKLPW